MGMLNAMRDKNEAKYRGGEGKTILNMACPGGHIGQSALRAEPQSKRGKKTIEIKRKRPAFWL